MGKIDRSTEVNRIESKIPYPVLRSIKRYVQEGIQPGGFVTSLLENDLRGTFMNADVQSMMALPVIMEYLFNCIPSACWGSPEAVDKWTEHFINKKLEDKGEAEVKPGT